ncbi:MAG: pyruvate kinase [Rikenellaceae bacterium]|jgi:pyruvate kinase|nr:pyruvate kinase [Rikenellaceae bacterium]
MQKNTKIVATISDQRCEVDFIRSLYEAGMNVVRINSAHVTPESATAIVENVRKVSDRIAILIDTKGPELRITAMEEAWAAGIPVTVDDVVRVKGTNDGTLSSDRFLYVNDDHVYRAVPVGASILIDDGDIELSVIGKKDEMLICHVNNDGTIKGKKSVNIPGVKINLPSLTEKDRLFIDWAIETQIDFIAHSFVRKKADVMAVQKILDEHNSPIKIISKIENQEGVDNIDDILDVTYGVMVARGDLGVELPAEQIPIAQRCLVDKCMVSKKPVIVATQMLHSMIKNPRPTRAEVSDIASAIYQRVDAIMLSGETANGDYPVEAVTTMAKIAAEIEKDTQPLTDMNMVRINNEITAQLSRSAVRATTNLPVKAILIDSMSGRTGRYIAAFRCPKPVFAVCYTPIAMRILALSYGIEAEYREPIGYLNDFPLNLMSDLKAEKKIKDRDMVVVVGGSFGVAKGASYMEIGTVKNLMDKMLGLNEMYNGEYGM